MNPPPDYPRDFLQLALQYQCLQFGEFTLKSGRRSPYFFNAGALNDGAALECVGACYAHAAIAHDISFDMLFGPAYKGIPLASSAAGALHRLYDRTIPVAFDRKEAKTHGDSGQTFGAPLSGRVLLIDDVISSGITVRTSVDLIRAHGAEVAGLLVLLDRGECGQNGAQSAAEELAEQCNVPVFSIVRAQDFQQILHDAPEYQQYHDQVEAYLERYGA